MRTTPVDTFILISDADLGAHQDHATLDQIMTRVEAAAALVPGVRSVEIAFRSGGLSSSLTSRILVRPCADADEPAGDTVAAMRQVISRRVARALGEPRDMARQARPALSAVA